MIRQKRFVFLLALVVFLTSWSFDSFSQNTFTSEADLKKQADKLFEEEDYVAAYPLYSQLLSIYPKDPNYNYRFGACLLYASENKEKAIPYLELAVKNPDVEKEAFYFLGKAYHITYRFDDAVLYYVKFKDVASKSQLQKYKVDKQIGMCINGKGLLRTITDLVVMDKKEVPDAEFFRAYDLENIGGKMLVKPDEFKTPLDIKKKENSIIFLSKTTDKVYYSSYGEDGKNGKDIYVVSRQADGEWSKPQSLGYPVNTDQDEDYPFLHPNGKVLYFASRGHNSMGGYDVFKSVYNEATGVWSSPQNLDFAINTPSDDIMFITDSLEQNACFSSARNSPSGKTAVFKIKTERKPIKEVFIAGTFVKTKPEEGQAIKITIKDLANNELVQTVSSDGNTGVYNIQLPNAGKYLFTVETDGFNSQSEAVSVPSQQTFVPLKQEIGYETASGKLEIRNMFDATEENSAYQMALEFIKERSKLEVNYNAATDNTPPIQTQPSAAVDTAKTQPTGSLSNDAIIKIAQDDAKEIEEEAKEVKQQADQAFAVAAQKNELATAKNTEAETAKSNANAISDPALKQTELQKAEALQREADQLTRETIAAFNFAKSLDIAAEAKKQEADLSTQYVKDLDAAVKSNNPNEALLQLEKQKELLEQLSRKNENLASTDNVYNNIKLEGERKQQDLDAAVVQSQRIPNDIVELEKQAAQARKDAEDNNNAQMKEALLAQATEIDQDIIDLKKEKENLDNVKIPKLQTEVQTIKGEGEVVLAMTEQLKSGTSPSVEATPVDKQKLEQQVNLYKNDLNITTQPAATVAVADQTPTNTSPSQASTQPTVKDSVPATQTQNIPSNVATNNSPANTNNTAPSNTNNSNAQQPVNTAVTNNNVASTPVSNNNQQTIATNDLMPNATGAEYFSQSSPIYTRENSKAVKANYEADSLAAVAEQQRTAALAIPDNDAKQQALQAANETEKRSNDKRNEANAAQSVANIAEYQKNQLALDEMSSITSKREESEISIANLLKDEAGVYFEKAQLARESAAQLTTESEKQDALNEAKEMERVALEKQKKSSELFLKYVPDYTPDSAKDMAAKINLNTAPSSAVAANNQNQPDNNTTSPSNNVQQPVATNNQNVNPSNIITTPVDTTQQTVAVVQQPPVVNPVDSAANARTNAVTEQPATVDTNATQTPIQQPVSTQPVVNENSPSYKDYVALNKEAEELQQTANNEYAVSAKYKQDFQAYLDSMRIYIALADSAKDETSKQTYVDKIKYFENLTAISKTKIDSVNALAKNSEQAAASKRQEAQLVADNTVKETNTPVQQQEQPKQNRPSPNYSAAYQGPAGNGKQGNNSVANQNAPVDEIVVVNKSPYSANNPIPINEKLPDGLIFKVQIGAFKNEIAQDNFGGVTPVSGETTPQGYIRYTAGIFTKIDKANDAKQTIRNSGYRDAFVVAFLNGKRIPIYEAMAMLNGGTSQNQGGNTTAQQTGSDQNATNTNPSVANNNAGNNNTNIPNNQNTTGNSGNNNNNQTSGTNLNQPANNTIVDNTPAPSTNLNGISGLLYTVQVGVYSRPVSSRQLFGISPLYNENTPSGYIRYTTGIFNNINPANEAKNKIVGLGVKDAFVISYLDGKRISLDEAKQLEVSRGSSVFTPTNNEMPVVNQSENTNNPTSPLTTNNQQQTTSSIVYKVQIGAYREQVPVEVTNSFFKVSQYGITNYKDDNGVTVYVIGNYQSYDEANRIKSDVASDVSGAFIVAYKDGKKISVEEARRLKGK